MFGHLTRASALSALAVAAYGAAASAQAPLAPSPSPSPSPAMREIGRVVTSDRRPETLSSVTRPTFVVDRETIEAFGSRTVSDALENVPGVNVFSYGAFGAQADYGLRGTTSEQTLVLRDGVPIATGSNGQIDLGTLSTIGVDRIEVVESGASTLYGSSATGGVINLISAARAQPFARVADGTYGDEDFAGESGAGGLALAFERHIANNVYAYPAFAFPGMAAQPAGTRTNADARQTALRLSYSQRLGDGWTARLSGGNDTIDLGVPGSLVFGTTPYARQGTARTDAQLDLSRGAGAGTLSLTLAGSAQRLAYADPGPQLGGEDDTYDGRAQASVRYAAAGTHSDLVTGVDLQRESAALSFGGPFAPPAFGAAESQAAAYAQFGYDPRATTRVIVGLRAENDAPRGGALAPSLGLGVALGSARLTANAGESFRVPTLIDLYYPGYANPDLAPERLSNYDLTLALPHAGNGLSFGYFGRDGSNLIVLNPTTSIPFNASRVCVNGLQLTAATRPYDHLRFNVSLTDVYRAVDTTTGNRLPSTPPLVATLGLERPFDGGRVAFGLRAHIVGSTPTDGPQPNPFDAYTDADAFVSYRFARFGVATVRLRNLGDARYEPIYGYPAPGRTVVFEFTTR